MLVFLNLSGLQQIKDSKPFAVASPHVSSTPPALDGLIPNALASPARLAPSVDDIAANNSDSCMLDGCGDELIFNQQNIGVYLASAFTIRVQPRSSRASFLPIQGDYLQKILTDYV